MKDLALLSPRLAGMRETSMPMPACAFGQKVTTGWAMSTNSISIAEFMSRVEILNTKTRPKRLALVGSDGQQYNFLLKVRKLQGQSSPAGINSLTSEWRL